ncbi:MAG: glycosyltransferase [Actinomycetota bacterium]|nr:glycosyltransferase [Actinomycetota bacterium]
MTVAGARSPALRRAVIGARSRRVGQADDGTVFDRAAAVLTGPAVRSRPSPQCTPGMASVLVPTHNDGANMGPLLERLLAEPCVGEVLVVASDCRDETVPTVLEAAARHDGRVCLYVEPVRSGKAAAVNFGLSETAYPYVVIVSGDVLPAPGAVGLLIEALSQPGVGLAGGRPVPVNPDTTPIGHAAQMLWRLHHRLALHRPKLGEMLALRAEAVVTLPRTSVDEACFQALVEAEGWRSVYVPEAVVENRAPENVHDFVKQRRQVHTGHLWLRHRQQYTVPSLNPSLLALELWRDLTDDRERLHPRRIAWTAGTIAMEAYARARARVDYLRGRENHVWEMVTSTKAPAAHQHRMGAGDR